MENEYRAYFFTNMYISDIQRGIQTAHCISDIHIKYAGLSNAQKTILTCWATFDKTIIVLNGGYSSHLLELSDIFGQQKEYPWDVFFESHEALDGALTCVGIILPDYIYETAKKFNKMRQYEKEQFLGRKVFSYNDVEFENTTIVSWLIGNLSNYRLA